MLVVENRIGMADTDGRTSETNMRGVVNPVLTMTAMARMAMDNPAGGWDTEYGLLCLEAPRRQRV